MRHTISRRQVMTAIAFSASSIASAQTKPPARAADPLRGLAKDVDKMTGVTQYRHPTSPQYVNRSGFYLTFVKSDSGQFSDIFLHVCYSADDWLFVKNAWAKADSIRLDLPQPDKKSIFGWERDNSGGTIWEWMKVRLTKPVDILNIRTIAEAKDVTVRFEGKQYYNDRKLTGQQLKAMREVIAAYEAVTGKPWR